MAIYLARLIKKNPFHQLTHVQWQMIAIKLNVTFGLFICRQESAIRRYIGENWAWERDWKVTAVIVAEVELHAQGAAPAPTLSKSWMPSERISGAMSKRLFERSNQFIRLIKRDKLTGVQRHFNESKRISFYASFLYKYRSFFVGKRNISAIATFILTFYFYLCCCMRPHTLVLFG